MQEELPFMPRCFLCVGTAAVIFPNFLGTMGVPVARISVQYKYVRLFRDSCISCTSSIGSRILHCDFKGILSWQTELNDKEVVSAGTALLGGS